MAEAVGNSMGSEMDFSIVAVKDGFGVGVVNDGFWVGETVTMDSSGAIVIAGIHDANDNIMMTRNSSFINASPISQKRTKLGCFFGQIILPPEL